MILFIDTSSDPAVISLLDEVTFDLIDKIEIQDKTELSEELLKTIDQMLKRNKIAKKNLKIIAVNPGPGSYTGVRIGVTVANFLSFSLQIPIISLMDIGKESIEKALIQNKLKAGFSILPVYKFPPHITKRKKS